VNESAHEMLVHPCMVDHSLPILTDRPEVDPRLRCFFRQALWSNDTVAGNGSPSIAGHIWTPGSGYLPSYNPDGNLKSDGRWD
jgi:hypothetical protein